MSQVTENLLFNSSNSGLIISSINADANHSRSNSVGFTQKIQNPSQIKRVKDGLLKNINKPRNMPIRNSWQPKEVKLIEGDFKSNKMLRMDKIPVSKDKID